MRKKQPEKTYYYDAEDRAYIKQILIERARLCDPERLANDYKALARIRRKAQLARAERCA